MNGGITAILERINAYIINPFILLLFTIAIVVFLWGIVEFIASDEGGDARERGKQNLVWGIVGLFVMVGVYGIIKLILNTMGVQHDFYFLP